MAIVNIVLSLMEESGLVVARSNPSGRVSHSLMV